MNPRRDFFILLAYSALALALTFPLISNFSTHVAGVETDAPTLAWNLWWVKYSIFNLRVSPLATDYLFYPVGIDLVAYTLTLFNGLLSLPIQFTTNLIAANNALVIFSLTLSAFGMYLLARDRLRRARLDERGALFAGALYGLGSYHLNYVALGRPELVANQWMPFYFFYLIRALESPRRALKSGAMAGLYLALTAWTEISLAAFLIVLTALYLGWRVYEVRRPTFESSRVSPRSVLIFFAALAFVALIALAPLWLDIIADVDRFGDYWTLNAPRTPILSADLFGFFLPASINPLLGRLTQNLPFQTINYSFAGFIPLALTIWSVARFRAARAWGALAFIFALLMLGPALSIFGATTSLPMPFALAQQIPILKAARFPIRFNALFVMTLALAASYGAAELARRARETNRAKIFAAVAVIALFEQLALPLPLTDLRAPAVYEQFRDDPGDFAILELPLGWRSSVTVQGKLDPRAQFFQSAHLKRLLGGTTSRSPQFKFQYFNELPVLNSIVALETGQELDAARRGLDREAALEILRFFNIHHVIINRALTDPNVQAYVTEIFPLQEVFRDNERTLYRVTTALATRGQVDARADLARLNFDDGWGRAQLSSDNFGYRWATASDARMWLPLTRADYRISFLAQTPRYQQKISVRINGNALDPIVGEDSWNAQTLHVPSIFLRNGLNEVVFSTELAPLDSTRQDDYAIGGTGAQAPVDIAATGAGFNAGSFGEIFVAGRNVIENKRGYQLVAIDSQTGRVDRVGAFDTFASADESRRMIQFIAALPRGEIVAGVAIDDVSQNLQPEAVDALKQVGVDNDLRFSFRSGHAFIGVKGAQPGQALESVDGRFPANVAVGKNVSADRVAFALGPVFFETVK